MPFLRHALDYLLGGPAVGGREEERLRRWLALPPADLTLPHARARYVVVVPEAGAGRLGERLVALAAVAVAQGRVAVGRGFAARLDSRPAPAGVPPASPPRSDTDALLAFLEFAGKSPLVALPTQTARPLVERAVRLTLGVPLRHPWIDLSALLAAAFPGAGCTTLAQWLDHCGLSDAWPPAARADPVAAAQLLLVALAAARRTGAASGHDVVERTDAEGAGRG